MKIQLRTKSYEVPSLTFAQVEQFEGDGTISKIPVPESARAAMLVPDLRNAMMALASAAVGVSRDELAGEIDLGNIGDLMAAVMGASKLERKENGAGEAAP